MSAGRALLVYRPGALGDTLVSLPALRLAQRRFGAHRTIFACAPGAVPLLTSNGVADVVVSADDVRLAPLLGGDCESLTHHFGPIEAAVLWGGVAVSAAASALRAHGAEVIHARSRPADDESVHVSAYLASTVAENAGELEPVQLTPSMNDRRWLDRELQGAFTKPLLAMHPGSGSRRKNWGPASFARLATLLTDDAQLDLALIAGPADDGILDEMLPALSHAPSIVARDWPLGRIAALLQRAELYVGNDSGISHLAGCLGVSGVALFGPTRADVWHPLGESLRALSKTAMHEHQPESVMAALRAALEVSAN